MKIRAFLPLLLAIGSAQGAIVWTGATDSNFFTATNWDFSGSTFSAANFTTANTITDSLVISGATGISLGSTLTLGDGVTLSLTNSSLTTTGAVGINGTNDAGDAFSYISLSGSSTLSSQFVAVGLDVTVGNGSSLVLRGTGDPVNSQTEATRVTLLPGGSLTFANATEYIEHIAEIFNASSGNSLATAPGDFSPASGATITAVPEPAALSLGALGLFTLIRRRRA